MLAMVPPEEEFLRTTVDSVSHTSTNRVPCFFCITNIFSCTNVVLNFFFLSFFSRFNMQLLVKYPLYIDKH